MNLTVTRTVHFRRGQNRQKIMADGPAPQASENIRPAVPRLTKLMALAISLDRQIKKGHLTDYAAMARAGHITRARATQIMNLLNLAPDIQEDILFLAHPRSISERDVRHIAIVPDWNKQRMLWKNL